MECLIIKDHCETCTYNLHALQLNNFTPIFIKELSNIRDTEDSMLFLCTELFGELKNNYNKTKIIVTGATQKSLPKNIFFLQTPYQWSALFSIILKIITSMSGTTYSDKKEYNYFHDIIGNSDSICAAKEAILKVSTCDTTVLLLGESGTGKDLFASSLHAMSTRKHKPFVPINCGAIPAELMESELFGHMKGAFTGALTSRPGRFEIADGGTLFLDEIGDMPPSMQVKLLRVLQDKMIQRIGSNDIKHVDVRIVAATNKNLRTLINQNLFREDLFYRISVFPIQIPPLRDRQTDIRMISEFWLNKIAQRNNKKVLLSEKSWNHILQHDWPGNIRELQNFLEKISILYSDQLIEFEQIKHCFSERNTDISTSHNTEIKHKKVKSNESSLSEMV